MEAPAATAELGLFKRPSVEDRYGRTRCLSLKCKGGHSDWTAFAHKRKFDIGRNWPKADVIGQK